MSRIRARQFRSEPMKTLRDLLLMAYRNGYSQGHTDASCPPPGLITEWSPDEWDRVKDLNLDAVPVSTRMTSPDAAILERVERLESLEKRLADYLAPGPVESRIAQLEEAHRLAQRVTGDRFDRVLERIAEIRDRTLPEGIVRRLDNLQADVETLTGASTVDTVKLTGRVRDMEARLGTMEHRTNAAAVRGDAHYERLIKNSHRLDDHWKRLGRLEESRKDMERNVAEVWDKVGENQAKGATVEQVKHLEALIVEDQGDLLVGLRDDLDHLSAQVEQSTPSERFSAHQLLMKVQNRVERLEAIITEETVTLLDGRTRIAHQRLEDVEARVRDEQLIRAKESNLLRDVRAAHRIAMSNVGERLETLEGAVEDLQDELKVDTIQPVRSSDDSEVPPC